MRISRNLQYRILYNSLVFSSLFYGTEFVDRYCMMKGNKVSGFTIIELMTVVIIIGILAAIAVPNFLKMSNKSKEAEVMSNMHTIQLGAEMYCVDYLGRYPPLADSIKQYLPGTLKNPFDKTDPALQDASVGDIEGVAEYQSGSPYDFYLITGFGKDAQPVSITLTEGIAL